MMTDKLQSSDIVEILKERSSYTSEKEVAISLGISPQYLNDVIKGRRNPGHKIVSALGLKRVIWYVREKRRN